MEEILNHAAYGDQSTGGHGLGRIFTPDPRDLGHLMATQLQEEGFDPSIRKREWEPGPTLNQGSEPACVGYSWKSLLLSGPVKNTDDIDPLWMYKEIQKIDEWPGEDYPGTSVRAGAKFLQALGYLNEYKWAFDVETIVKWLLNKGPVVLGTTWFTGMNTPDNQGFIHPTGIPQGGHAYEADAADRDMKCPDGSIGAARIHQTWGGWWGLNGFAWISFKELTPLILNNGEACTPTEVLKGKPTPPEPPKPEPPPLPDNLIFSGKVKISEAENFVIVPSDRSPAAAKAREVFKRRNVDVTVRLK